MWWVGGLALVGLLAWRAGPSLRRRLAARRAAQAVRIAAVARVRARAEALSVACAMGQPAVLSSQAADLRSRVRATADPGAAYLRWQRILGLEGPQSDAWVGLARSAILGGRPQAALAAAAEAVRVGHATWDLLPALAASALHSAGGADLAAARLVMDVDTAPAAEWGQLYHRLHRLQGGVVLPRVLWLRLLERVADPEEALRQDETWRPPVELDPWPAAWLDAAWAQELSLAPLHARDDPLVVACRADQQAGRESWPTAQAVLADLRREGFSPAWHVLIPTLSGAPRVWLEAVGKAFQEAGRKAERDGFALHVAPLLLDELNPALVAGWATFWQADWAARWRAAVSEWLAAGRPGD